MLPSYGKRLVSFAIDTSLELNSDNDYILSDPHLYGDK